MGVYGGSDKVYDRGTEEGDIKRSAVDLLDFTDNFQCCTAAKGGCICD